MLSGRHAAGRRKATMHDIDLMEAIQEICRKDPRYDPEAYLFMRDALDYTVRTLKKPLRGPERHVTAHELLEGIRPYAIAEYGPMALTVLNAWGIKTTEDFGEIVFNLVETGRLGKTDDDRKEDFRDGYAFHETFAAPFLPRPGRTGRRKGARTRTGKNPAISPDKQSAKQDEAKGDRHGKTERTG